MSMPGGKSGRRPRSSPSRNLYWGLGVGGWGWGLGVGVGVGVGVGASSRGVASRTDSQTHQPTPQAQTQPPLPGQNNQTAGDSLEPPLLGPLRVGPQLQVLRDRVHHVCQCGRGAAAMRMSGTGSARNASAMRGQCEANARAMQGQCKGNARAMRGPGLLRKNEPPNRTPTSTHLCGAWTPGGCRGASAPARSTAPGAARPAAWRWRWTRRLCVVSFLGAGLRAWSWVWRGGGGRRKMCFGFMVVRVVDKTAPHPTPPHPTPRLRRAPVATSESYMSFRGPNSSFLSPKQSPSARDWRTDRLGLIMHWCSTSRVSQSLGLGVWGWGVGVGVEVGIEGLGVGVGG